MAIERTLTGDVEAGQLGPTTMHEHIFGDFTVWQEDPKQTVSWGRSHRSQRTSGMASSG